MRRWFVALAIAAVVAAAASAQSPNTFRTSTTLVVRPVAVLDAAGRPMEGLTIDDFIVQEDGVPQSLAFVEFQRLRDEAAPAGVPPAPTVVADDVPSPTATAIGTGGVDRQRYSDRRLLVFYFDLPAMSDADRARAYSSAIRFVALQMSAADVVAVMTFSGAGVHVWQDFTDDRARLSDVLRTLRDGVDRDGDGIPDPPPDEATDFGQNGGEFNFLRTDRQLAALQTAVTMLKPLAEQKTLMYFVSGLNLSGLDNQAQLSATVNAAIRSNVSINPIDARGLVAEAPLGGANVPSPAGIGAFNGSTAQARRDRFDRSQDTLYAMAKDTGGTALFDSNDLALGIRRAAAAVTNYYILGYYPTHAAKDGRFRRVTITVKNHPGAKLVYSQGYFGEKEFAKFTAADRERQLEDALMLGDPITEIPMAMEVNYFQINRSEYFVPVSLKLPAQALAADGGARSSRVNVDLIGEVKDERGVTVQNVRDKLEIPLTPERAAELASRPVQYETGFTLLPGRYTIKLLARDAGTGRMGTYLSDFAVPNLNRETAAVRTSSIVLGAQRVGVDDAVFSVRQKVARGIANPLVSHGTKLLPSVTRVFSASRSLYVLFDAYRMDGVPNGPLLAYVSLFKGADKVVDSDPVQADMTTAVVPFEFTLPLTGLSPGPYTCQVSVLDLGQHKVRFWRLPLQVVP